MMNIIESILSLDTQDALDYISYSDTKTKGIVASLAEQTEVFPKLFLVNFQSMHLIGCFVIDINTSNSNLKL